MSQKIRVGIAGAGFIGAVHAHAYMQLPDVEIVGIGDPIAEKAAPLAKETGSRIFRDYDELLGAGIDVLNVCPAACTASAGCPRRRERGDACADGKTNRPYGGRSRPNDCRLQKVGSESDDGLYASLHPK